MQITFNADTLKDLKNQMCKFCNLKERADHDEVLNIIHHILSP